MIKVYTMAVDIDTKDSTGLPDLVSSAIEEHLDKHYGINATVHDIRETVDIPGEATHYCGSLVGVHVLYKKVLVEGRATPKWFTWYGGGWKPSVEPAQEGRIAIGNADFE